MKYTVAARLSVILLLASLAAGDEKQPLTFRLTIMGEMEDTAATKAGFRTSYFQTTHLGFRKYDASDGKQVDIYNGAFNSANEARKYFDWNLRNRAAQIVMRGNKRNLEGKIIGRRAEYLAKSETNEKAWIVMWTNWEHFHLVSGPSLECAVALEKECRN